MNILAWLLLSAITIFIIVFYMILRMKDMHLWFLPYLIHTFHAIVFKQKNTPTHIYLSINDHFEPWYAKPSDERAFERVDEWCARYPLIAQKFKDSDGKHPRYTMFYPIEEYNSEVMEKISRQCHKGYFDVEIHLHHDDDTSENLRDTLLDFKKLLHEKHGLLRYGNNGKDIIYGFIHGNWALDNSLPDGKWCGVNDEITVLKETGCYADFTFPSAPSLTQPKTINSIYYAKDNPNKPKSYNTGKLVSALTKNSGDLMLVEGPLTLNWKNRKFGFLPRIENSDLSHEIDVTEERIKLWISCGVSVEGKPNHIFIKLHTHGCDDDNLSALLGNQLEKLYGILTEKFNDGTNYFLHFVTAYEMYETIKKLENNEID